MNDYKHNLKKTDGIFTDIISLSEKVILSKYSQLTSATRKGLVFHSKKQFLPVPQGDILRFLNQPVELFLSHYELPFFGVLRNISEVEGDTLEIFVDFTKETPLYYRECVEDLLN